MGEARERRKDRAVEARGRERGGGEGRIQHGGGRGKSPRRGKGGRGLYDRRGGSNERVGPTNGRLETQDLLMADDRFA